MRQLALFLAVALSGCSLIRTETPAPVATWTRRSECSDSIGWPALDLGVAATGGFMAAGGVVTAVNPNGPPSSDPTGDTIRGVGIAAAGVAVAGLFITSAVVGFRRTSACQAALAEWGPREDELRRAEWARRAELEAEAARQRAAAQAEVERQKAARRGAIERAARAYLQCPEAPLDYREIVDRSDSKEESWAEVVGCDRDAWCNSSEAEQCGPSHALRLVEQQLSVETGCASGSIQQIQRLDLNTQLTYRLTACGGTYACTTLIERERNGSTDVVSKFGSMITCKQAPAH